MDTIDMVVPIRPPEIKLSYSTKIPASRRQKIGCSSDAYEVFYKTWDRSKLEFLEQFKILVLNRANRLYGVLEVSTGSPTGTLADPKVIFAASLKSNAQGIILAHNHPSGNLTPSTADFDTTNTIEGFIRKSEKSPRPRARFHQIWRFSN